MQRSALTRPAFLLTFLPSLRPRRPPTLIRTRPTMSAADPPEAPPAPPGADDVNTYLRASRTCLTTGGTTVYLGNEACDLDSAACALALAYADAESGRLTLPVLNVARCELRLRRDVQHALEAAGIDARLLTFADEVDLADVLARGPASLTLVDHNALSVRQRALRRHVARIVDHHADVGEHARAVGDSRVIARTGSCASLVSAEVADDGRIPAPLARLLLAAVLVDTHGLERATTPADERAAARLGRIAGVPKDKWPVFGKEIRVLRGLVDGFSARDLLVKDFKTFEGKLGLAGISSASTPLGEWAEAEAERRLTKEVLAGMMKAKGVDAMLVMTSFTREAKFCREMLVFGESEAARTIREKLPGRPDMKLTPMSVPGFPDGICYAQNNLEASRKRTSPQVVAVLGAKTDRTNGESPGVQLPGTQ